MTASAFDIYKNGGTIDEAQAQFEAQQKPEQGATTQKVSAKGNSHLKFSATDYLKKTPALSVELYGAGKNTAGTVGAFIFKNTFKALTLGALGIGGLVLSTITAVGTLVLGILGVGIMMTPVGNLVLLAGGIYLYKQDQELKKEIEELKFADLPELGDDNQPTQPKILSENKVIGDVSSDDYIKFAEKTNAAAPKIEEAPKADTPKTFEDTRTIFQSFAPKFLGGLDAPKTYEEVIAEGYNS